MQQILAVALILLATAGTVTAQGMEVKVLSGAVGLDDRSAMMAEFGQYNLHLAFARSNGEFLANVKVAIRDRRGNIVYEGMSDGPLFFARLPKGTYEVTTDFEGKAQKRKVEIGSGILPMMYIRWS